MSASHARYGSDDLGTAIREVAEFLSGAQWGAVPAMFALVPTTVLAETDPALLDRLDDTSLTPVEQEPLYEDADLHPAALGEALSGLAWPEAVEGCVLAREIVVLPPGADADPEAAAGNPQRRQARLYAAVLRDGTGLSLLQLRPDDPDLPDGGDPDAVELLRYEGLGEGLLDALRATFDRDGGGEA